MFIVKIMRNMLSRAFHLLFICRVPSRTNDFTSIKKNAGLSFHLPVTLPLSQIDFWDIIFLAKFQI